MCLEKGKYEGTCEDNVEGVIIPDFEAGRAIILAGDNTWQFKMISIGQPGVGGAAQGNNNQHCIIKYFLFGEIVKNDVYIAS